MRPLEMNAHAPAIRQSAYTELLSEHDSLLPWYAFAAAIERSLRMLHGVHIPVSLCAIRADRGVPAEALAVVGEALCQFGAAGRLADGSIGLLYLGPHEHDSGGALANFLRKRIESRLHEGGLNALGRRIDIKVARRWTDEIDDSSELVSLLDPARRP